MSKHIELLNKIFESSKAKTDFKKGAFIYHEGEVADGVYRVIQGRVKLLKHDTDFKRSIILNIIKR